MTDTETQDLVRELDPFGFLIGQASAIRPLGGDQRGTDPRYAFHTPYVEFSPGRVVFSIIFDRLQASVGELRVNINAFIPGSGRDAMFVTSARLGLADRASRERGLKISIVSVAGATYAAHGYCTEGTDARAAAISITAEQIVSGGESHDDHSMLPTRLGHAPLENPVRLVDDSVTSFRDPVSQAMTDAQLAEPDYRRWLDKLLPGIADDRQRWRLAYIAQVLDRYGMLRPGAQGIALGADAAALTSIVTAAGCEVAAASLPAGQDVADFSWGAVGCVSLGALADPDGSGAGALALLADQPLDRRGFDFLWSTDIAGAAFATGRCAKMLTDMMSVLRPNGYAVHMFDLAPLDTGPAGTLPRAEVEKLAIMLISRGFTVAQLNFGDPTQDPVPFGLIVRKA